VTVPAAGGDGGGFKRLPESYQLTTVSFAGAGGGGPADSLWPESYQLTTVAGTGALDGAEGGVARGVGRVVGAESRLPGGGQRPAPR